MCYVNTGSFIVYIKIDDIYKAIAEDVETRFDTSNYEWDRPLPKGKKLKSYCINERWIRWKTHDKICWITYVYLDDGREDKKAKGTKKCVIKRKRKSLNF